MEPVFPVPALAAADAALPALLPRLAAARDLLVIQDLDGVCMPLVRDPLTRRLDPAYLDACAAMGGDFFVLTNGEHVGSRGVNAIVDRALGSTGGENHHRYLPGLAAGGVQWQGPDGVVEHPGVTDAELAFLAALPERFREWLLRWLHSLAPTLPSETAKAVVDACVLDNRVSPTLNLNSAHHALRQHSGAYRRLQEDCVTLLAGCLEEAEHRGLAGSFFIHYAPNLGRGAGGERLKPATDADAGTTDFQFMLSGAVKEGGVLDLVNRWCAVHRGRAPLGRAFSARTAPGTLEELLQLAADAFEPPDLPLIVGVGDTVTSVRGPGGWQRGGSDRGFLTLVQGLGSLAGRDNLVCFVDSSGGEVRRPGVAWDRYEAGDRMAALDGITDPGDALKLNVLFRSHHQYLEFFQQLRSARRAA